jgi:hypothetical protein
MSVHDDAAARVVFRQTLVFSVASAVNGVLVGVIGPSLSQLGESTGLSEAGLARVVLTNRVSKFLGGFIWLAFANGYENGRATISPRAMLILCELTIALCALLVATCRHSTLALYIGLAGPGVAYGLADAAFVQLCVWANRFASRKRFHVALLNVGFTVGALGGPAVVGMALRHGLSPYCGFYSLSALAAFVVPLLLITKEPTNSFGQEGCASPAVVRAAPQVEDGGDASNKRASPQALHTDEEGEAAAAPCAQDTTGIALPTPPLPPSPARARFMIGCMALALFSTTGCEHSLATWLPTYGQRIGRLSMEEMAAMSTGFWCMIMVSRVLWASVAAFVSSGYPFLLANGATMLASGLLIGDWRAHVSRHMHNMDMDMDMGAGRTTHGSGTSIASFRASAGHLALGPSTGHGWGGAHGSRELWVGTCMLGFSCMSYVVAITLPSEAQVELTPTRLLVLNLAGSAGEMAVPFFVGIAFEAGKYRVFGLCLIALSSLLCICTLASWHTASRTGRRDADGADEVEFERVALVQGADACADAHKFEPRGVAL